MGSRRMEVEVDLTVGGVLYVMIDLYVSWSWRAKSVACYINRSHAVALK